MPLKRDSDPVDYAALMVKEGLDPAEGIMLDVGDTGFAENFASPAYRIECAPAGGRHTARIVLDRRAAEGDNTSIHLRAGVFESNYSLSLKMLEADRKKGNVGRIGNYLEDFAFSKANRVYLSMPAAMGARNRLAEVEHCDDLIYAHQQTLGTLDAALIALAPVTAATEDEARRRLLADLRAALPADRAGLGVDVATWVQEYERLREQTRDRDQNGWHSFGLELLDAANVPGRDTPTYLTGAKRDAAGFPVYYVGFTTGDTEIGTHPTNRVIV